MSAWGKTGRVVLAQYTDTDGETWPDYDVYADGEYVGRTQQPVPTGLWDANTRTQLGPVNLPSLDAAVMWVLRRAATDVWRAERPVVWRVYRRRSAVTWGAWNWLADSLTDPDEIGGTDVLHRSLLAWADREARAEYARRAATS